MASCHRLEVSENVRNGQPAFANAAVEVVLVTFRRFSLVQIASIFVGVLAFVPILFDRFTRDLAAAYEDATFGAFE